MDSLNTEGNRTSAVSESAQGKIPFPLVVIALVGALFFGAIAFWLTTLLSEPNWLWIGMAVLGIAILSILTYGIYRKVTPPATTTTTAAPTTAPVTTAPARLRLWNKWTKLAILLAIILVLGSYAKDWVGGISWSTASASSLSASDGAIAEHELTLTSEWSEWVEIPVGHMSLVGMTDFAYNVQIRRPGSRGKVGNIYFFPAESACRWIGEPTEAVRYRKATGVNVEAKLKVSILRYKGDPGFCSEASTKPAERLLATAPLFGLRGGAMISTAR